MWKKIAIAGAVGAAVLGGGAAALAASTPSPTSGSGTPATAGSTATPKAGGHPRAAALLKRLQHGEVVTDGKNGDVTHDLVLGDVTAVSPTSITVKAKDGFSETFTVGSGTHVRVRTGGKGAAGTISQVKTGTTAMVTGVRSGSTVTAGMIVDRTG